MRDPRQTLTLALSSMNKSVAHTCSAAPDKIQLIIWNKENQAPAIDTTSYMQQTCQSSTRADSTTTREDTHTPLHLLLHRIDLPLKHRKLNKQGHPANLTAIEGRLGRDGRDIHVVVVRGRHVGPCLPHGQTEGEGHRAVGVDQTHARVSVLERLLHGEGRVEYGYVEAWLEDAA